MGKMSRRKGHGYENYIAGLFRENGWEDAKRHLEFQMVEAEEGRDLDNTQPFAIQCKHLKRTPSIQVINELKVTYDYPLRVAILKRTRSKGIPPLEVAVIDLKLFFDMISILTEEQLLDILEGYDI